MTKTEHYQLNQWEATDKLSRANFNSDNAVIDAALAGKANSADVTAVSQSVAALETLVGGKGNCRIATGSYVGDGKYGASNPCTLSFDFKPLWLMIGEGQTSESTTPEMMDTSFFVYPSRGASSVSGKALRVTWADDYVKWYCTSSLSSAGAQNNTEGCTYYWVALGVNE